MEHPPAVEPEPEHEPEEGTVLPEQVLTAGINAVSPEQQAGTAQSDSTEPGRQVEKADQSSTLPNEVSPSQSADKIEASSADPRPAELKQTRRYRNRTVVAPGAGSTVDMSAAPPSELDIYVPVSSRVDIVQFTHAASSNALLETQNAGPPHFRGRLTAAGKTDTLQQMPQNKGASRMICADTPMRRGTQFADFSLRAWTHPMRLQELFRFVETRHDGILTRRELQTELIHPNEDLKRHVKEAGLSTWLSEKVKLFEHLTDPKDGPITENEFVEYCEHIEIDTPAGTKSLPRFLVGVSVVETKGGVQTATGRHVSFCPDRSQLITTTADGKEESFPCNLPAGMKLLHPQQHMVGLKVEFKRRDQAELSVIIGHDSVSLPMCINLSPGEWLCWSAQVSAAYSELAKDEITISAGRWRAQNYVRIGSEVCVSHRHINVLGRDFPFVPVGAGDGQTGFITRTIEDNGDMRVSGTPEAVWNTVRVSEGLPHGTHYAEFHVATDPEQNGTGRSWMVGVARPTGSICSAMHSYTRDDIWAFAGGESRQGGGKLNRGFHGVDPTIRTLVAEAVNGATGSNGGYRGSPVYRELDAKATNLKRAIKQHHMDEKEAAVHDNDAERALDLRRQAEVAEQHLDLLLEQLDDQKRKDMRTLMHWESLENRVAQLLKRRHAMTSAGIYDCQVVIPLQTLLQESEHPQQAGNTRVGVLKKTENYEACEANLYATAAGAIKKLLRRVEDQRVAARTQFAGVEDITVGGAGGDNAAVNGSYLAAEPAGTAEVDAKQQMLEPQAEAAEPLLNDAAPTLPSEQLDDQLCALYDQAIAKGVDESKLEKIVKRMAIDKHIEELRKQRDTICRQLQPVLDELAASDEKWEEKVRSSGGRQTSGSWDGMKTAKPGDVLGLLLDLPPDGPNTGSLRVYKNGHFLGTMATGLHGDFCWCVTLCDGEHITVRRNPKCFPTKQISERYRVLSSSAIYQTPTADSAVVGKLEEGNVIVGMSTKIVDGMKRVQFERGWVSMTGQLEKLSEVRPWSNTLYDRGKDIEKLKLDASKAAIECTMAHAANSKEPERQQWITRAKEADATSRKLKLAQHFYHRKKMSVGHSAACLHGSEYSDVTLTEMQDICTKLQPDKPIGFMFQAKSGDAEGRGTGQLLTGEALKDSNYRRVPEYFYTTKHLEGVTIDRKDYNLSNTEAMKAAVAHCRVIKADGFQFFAQDTLPNRIVTCLFKRRLLSEVSQSIPTEDFNAADAIVMDGLMLKGLIQPGALEFWTGVYDRIVTAESVESTGRGSFSKEDIIKSMCDEKIVADEELERVLPKPAVIKLRKVGHPTTMEQFWKFFEFIDAPTLSVAKFVSAMARQEIKLKHNHMKKKSNSSTQVDSWTDQERLQVQQRLYSPRSSSGTQYSVAGLDASDTILLEALPSAQRRRLTAAFRRIDGNSNGAVTKNELVKGLSHELDLLALVVPDVQRFLSGNYESQMQAFRFIDGDGSRTLTCTEFVLRMVKQLMTRAEESERAMMLSAESEDGDWHAYTVRPAQDGVYLWTDVPGSLPPLIFQPQAPRMTKTLAQTQKINPKYDTHNQLQYPFAFGSSAPTHWMRHQVATGQRSKSGPEFTLELPLTADDDQPTATDLPVLKKQHNAMTGQTARVVESVPDRMHDLNPELRPGLILYSVQDEPSQGMALERYKALTQQRPLKLGFVSSWDKLCTARPVAAKRSNKDRTDFKTTPFKAKYEWAPNRKDQMVWAKPLDLDGVEDLLTLEASSEKINQAMKQRKKKTAAKNRSQGVYPVGTKESTPQPSPRYKRVQIAGADHRSSPAATRYDTKPSSWWQRDALVSDLTEQGANQRPRFKPCSGETGRDGGEAFQQWTARFNAAPPQKAPAAAHKIPAHQKTDKVAVPPTPRGFGSTVATYRGTQSPFVPWSKQQMSRAMLAEWQQSQQAHIDFSRVRIQVMGSTLPLPKYRYEGQPNKDAKWAAFSRKETEELEAAIFDAIDDPTKMSSVDCDVGFEVSKTRMACRQSSVGSSLVVHWPELEQDQTKVISQHEWKFYMGAIRRKLGGEYDDFIIELACKSALGDEFDFGTELAGLLCQIDAGRSMGISRKNFSNLHSEGDDAAMEMVPNILKELSERLQISFLDIVNQLHVTGSKTEGLRDILQRVMKTQVCKLFPDWPTAPSKVQQLSQAATSDLLRDGGTISKAFFGVIEQPTKLKGVQVLSNKEATTTCCGEYKFAGMRNGRPCFNRVDAKPGALYFDGSYWKLTNEGAARTEIQWNYSQMQNPTSPVPPLGSWSAQSSKGGLTEVDYGKLRLKVTAGQEVLRPKSELPIDVPRVGNIGVDFATWKQSRKFEGDVTMRQLVSPRNWASGVPASLTFVSSLDAKEGLRPARIEYSHGMASVEKLKVEKEKFGFGSGAPTYRGDSAGMGMLSGQYVGLGDLWYTLTPRAHPSDDNQAASPHQQTQSAKSATSPRRKRPKSAPLQRSVRSTPRRVTWMEELIEPTGSVLGGVAGASPHSFAQTAATYQVAVPPALTNKILPKKAVSVKPPATSPPIVSNDEQIVRLKALQEVKHLTDTLERGLHRGQADLKSELQQLMRDQRQERQQNMLGTHELVTAELNSRIHHLQQGWETHARTVQTGVDEMKAELKAWGAGTRHAVSGVDDSAAAAIKAVEATHAKMLHDRWGTMEFELERQRKAFEHEIHKLQDQVFRAEKVRVAQMEAGLNGIAKSLTDGLDEVAHRLDHQARIQTDKSPRVRDTKPAGPQAEVRWTARPPVEARPAAPPMKHSMQQQSTSKPEDAVGNDATYVAREPWSVGRSTLAGGMTGATITSRTTPHSLSRVDEISAKQTAHIVPHGSTLAKSQEHRRATGEPEPVHPQPPPATSGVQPDATRADQTTSRTVGEMIGLLKVELELADTLSVPAVVADASTILECTFPDGTSLRKKVQLLCDECGIKTSMSAAARPAPFPAPGPVPPVLPSADSTQPTVEDLLNDAVSRLEALAEYPGQRAGAQQILPTAVSTAKIDRHVEHVKQYPPLKKAVQVDMGVDATDPHQRSDKSQEEKIAIAVAEGVKKSLADGLFEAGWQRQEHLHAIRSEIDAVRQDAEASVAREMIKMRMDARQKAQDERERNMRRSLDAVNAQREKALAEREAQLNAKSREAALARREALLAATEQQSRLAAAAATQNGPVVTVGLPHMAAATPRPPTQPTTPPSEPLSELDGTAPKADQAGPRKRRDALFEHLNLLKGLKMRGLLDESEYEKRKHSILDKYEAAGSQLVK